MPSSCGDILLSSGVQVTQHYAASLGTGQEDRGWRNNVKARDAEGKWREGKEEGGMRKEEGGRRDEEGGSKNKRERHAWNKLALLGWAVVG